MAFRTRWGLFEYLVIPFGVKNGPGTFQQYVNDTLHEFLDVFVTAYIDDILIYSSSLSEHRKHVRMVLERLGDAGLQCNIKKCKFHATEVMYLGLIISRGRIKMDPEKVAAITGTFSIENQIVKEGAWNVLLVDDLFHTGATMEAACASLRTYDKVKNVYVAALTWK